MAFQLKRTKDGMALYREMLDTVGHHMPITDLHRYLNPPVSYQVFYRFAIGLPITEEAFDHIQRAWNARTFRRLKDGDLFTVATLAKEVLGIAMSVDELAREFTVYRCGHDPKK